MSIYDKSSLVLIPSGTKTGKVFSQKPVSGDGDFTFTRASAATRVNADGNIEKETQNLLTYSNDFSGNWLRYNATNTSGQSGYDGSNDATLVTATGTFCRTYKNISGSGVYTGSVYVKAGTAPWALFRIQGTNNNQLYVSLSDGSYVVSGGDVISQKVESVGSGWYRLELSINTSLVTLNVYAALNNGDLETSNETIYIQDAQLNQGLIAQEVITTTTAAVYGGITDNTPRLDYTDSSCPALLLEPLRTNIQPYSEYVNAYTKSRSTITTNATTSPEGVSNASKVIPLSTSTGWSGINAPNYSFTSGQTYTLSVFAKAGEYNYCQVGGSTPAFNGSFATINLTNGVVEHESGITASTEDYGDGWYRISFTHTAIATASSPIGFFAVYSTAVSSRLVAQVGDNVSGVYIFGWMAELGSFSTSYIPTYGSSVSRVAETNSVTGISSLINNSEGTLFIEAATLENGANCRITYSDGTINNRVSIEWDILANTIKGFIGTSGNVETTSYDQTIMNKIALVYNATDARLFINGTKVFTDSSVPSLSGMDRLEFSNYGGALPFVGNTKQLLILKEKLTDQEAIDLTTI